MLAGQVMVGNWVSFTVTVNWQVDVAPAPSVALRAMVVVPTGKVAPLPVPLPDPVRALLNV